MKRKELRRMNFLCSQLYPKTKEQWDNIKDKIDIKRPGVKEYLELFSLFEKHKFTESEIDSFWWNCRIERNRKTNYNTKPVRVRKDNKDCVTYNSTTYCSNANKIRYPSKVRKTSWKRFYKLFPHLKPKDNVATN